jgi:hypothetical protein
MRHLPLASLLALAAACTGTGRPVDSVGNGHGKADGDSSCPVTDYDADKIIAAIEGGGSCYVAAGIAESCAYGSSLDVQFVAAATELCQRGFDAMTDADTEAYETLLGHCAAKYRDTEGTLYRSMNAYCDLEVTQLFNDLFPEPEYGEPAVPYSESCPVVESDPDNIEHAISNASSCSSAASIAGACAWGSSIDTQFAGAASELCSGETGELSAADAALHDQLVESCNALYTEGSGTLQLSVAAMCRMHVDVVFNMLASEVE